MPPDILSSNLGLAAEEITMFANVYSCKTYDYKVFQLNKEICADTFNLHTNEIQCDVLALSPQFKISRMLMLVGLEYLFTSV